MTTLRLILAFLRFFGIRPLPTRRHISAHVVTASAVCDSGIVFARDLSSAEIPTGEPPSDLQWMPPGVHTIQAKRAGKDWTGIVIVDEAAAQRVQRKFAAMLARAKAGTADLPFFDRNHDDAEATAHPTEFYWGGNDPIKGGIRAKVEWTQVGRDAVLGRAYRRFSPAFRPNDDGTFDIEGENLGGLVNRAAFRKLAPLVLAKPGLNAGAPAVSKADFMARAAALAQARGISEDDALIALQKEDPHAYYAAFYPDAGSMSPEEQKQAEIDADFVLEKSREATAALLKIQGAYGIGFANAAERLAEQDPVLSRALIAVNHAGANLPSVVEWIKTGQGDPFGDRANEAAQAASEAERARAEAMP